MVTGFEVAIILAEMRFFLLATGSSAPFGEIVILVTHLQTARELCDGHVYPFLSQIGRGASAVSVGISTPKALT